MLVTSVVKGKFFSKIGEEHADYRKWEQSHGMQERLAARP